MISYKIQNKISRAALDSIRVGGYYGDSIDTYLSGRVTSDYAQSVAYKEAEDAFVNQLDDKTAAGLWQGEFWGKWILSACRAAKYLNSDDLRKFIHNGAKKLMTLQRADG